MLEIIKKYAYQDGKPLLDLNRKHFEKMQKEIKKQEKVDLKLDEVESLYLYMIA